MKRGEIYYIQRRDTFGSEITKARPAIVVSNDALNATSGTVEVVFLTTQPKKDLPTHVTIRSTGVESTALCEQISTVSTLLVGNLCGVCTEQEMGAVSAAMLASLGISALSGEPETEEDADDYYLDYVRVCAERDTYKALLERFLPAGAGGLSD